MYCLVLEKYHPFRKAEILDQAKAMSEKTKVHVKVSTALSARAKFDEAVNKKTRKELHLAVSKEKQRGRND